MKKILLILLMAFCFIQCNKDEGLLKVGDFAFEDLTQLPDEIDESSGLEMAATAECWSFNDGGGEPELYRVDTNGVLKQTLVVTNADNVDWEDITKDADGHLYVGDFGNNDNDRQNLVIYKLDAADIASGQNQVNATTIEFHFPDQTEFPPPGWEQHFDVEAMFNANGYLYVLTRDRTDPFTGKTRLYQLPSEPGNYEATYINQYFTDTKKSRGQVTAADLSPDGSTLAMISNTVIWLFQNISGDDFLGGDVLKLDLPVQLDMEGLVFQDDCTLLLSNEDKPDKPAILYRIKLCQ